MGATGTISVLFTDIVGSTSLMESIGAQAWDEHRRAHFNVVREALTTHGGTEVKNTGDGVMAVFGSVTDMVECASAIQVTVHGARLGGGLVDVRVGGSIGEATNENDDWFGTPVVEAARLCALAQPGESLVTGVVQALAGSADVAFESLEPVMLKGFERPIAVARVVDRTNRMFTSTAYTDLDRLAANGVNIVRSLDYWGTLDGIRSARAEVETQLHLKPGASICDIGCGAGSELVRSALAVGPTGRAVGIDPSTALLGIARERANNAGVAVELLAVDGRSTGLDDCSFDAVRIERVVQHSGDIEGFLAEAYRLVKPGGRVVIADTDWGSLMIHPGPPDWVKRLRNTFENGPWAVPWAGRQLHGSLAASGFTDVASTAFVVNAKPGLMQATAGATSRLIAAGITSEAEMQEYGDALEAALSDGSGVWAFVEYVASGTRPS